MPKATDDPPTAARMAITSFIMWVIHSSSMCLFAWNSETLAELYGFAGIFASVLLKTSLACVYFTYLPKVVPSEKRVNEVNSYEEESWGFIIKFLLVRYLPLVIIESIFMHRLFLWDSLFAEEIEGGPVWLQFIYFVPKSLLFEILFDFFYYWGHRACHVNKTLFTWVHAEHHEHAKPGPLTTYNMTVVEYVSTVLVPSLISFALCGLQYTRFQMQLLLAYRTSGEVAGHSGLTAPHWTSFAQFPWIIPSASTLRIVDHDLHHSRNLVNFSKRFLLWDVIFGTFDTLEGVEEKRFQRRLNVRLQVKGLTRRLSSIVIKAKPSRRETVLNPIGIDHLQEEEARKKTRLPRFASARVTRSSFEETKKEM